MKNHDIPQGEGLRDKILAGYPAKLAKKRAPQLVVNRKDDADNVPPVKANVRTTPGIITQRGCCYAGCKGVVLGPTRDIINLVHGPVGCSFYAWLTRRNQTRPPTDQDENFMTYCFTTDMQDENIVFGGEKKLRAAVQEAYDLFHPKAIGIFSTCPVGLIGDDVHAVAKEMKEKLGINIFGFSCEGYKGVSQSAGHHIANNQLFKHVVGTNETPRPEKFKINLLGEYNIGGDAFEIDELFKRCGFELVATFSGNSTYGSFANSHTADLNMVMCHRSINYVAEMMEKKYGIPWIKVSFVSANGTAKSLRKMAAYFEDADLIARTEAIIEEELAKAEIQRQKYAARTKGKTAMLFVGGSRAHHFQDLFKELEMNVLAAGYEFAHRDDYEGRRVISSIKVDADSRNIEELHIDADPEKFRPRVDSEAEARLASKGFKFKDYEGMMPEMDSKTLIIDDISAYDTEKLIEMWKPDVFCAGIKEKFVVQKMGVPCKQLHNYDVGGPYNAFRGAVNFYRDIDRMVNSPVWKLTLAPWQESAELALEASAA